jgi:hypothetical protein
MRNIIILILCMLASSQVRAEGKELKSEINKAAKAEEKKVIKKIRYKKTQELSFDSEGVDGVVRNPYGAYLTQKKGMEFAPLYKVRERFDENIKDSVHYMKVAK